MFILKFHYSLFYILDHLMPTCARDPELHQNKRQKLSLEIKTELLCPNFINNFKKTWNQNVSLSNQHLELIVDPFKVCVIQDFLSNKELVENIRQEFYELDFNPRSMDLYEFFQSKDLKYLNSEHLNNFYDFLRTNVMSWVWSACGLRKTLQYYT